MGESTRPRGEGSRGAGGSGGAGGGGQLASKNWQFRSVVKGRESLPATKFPRGEQDDLHALWSSNVWGDVRRQSNDPESSEAKRQKRSSALGTAQRAMEPPVMSHDVAKKEEQLRRKLAAYATFNRGEKELLSQAFARVCNDHGGVPGLASRPEFVDVWWGGVRCKLHPRLDKAPAGFKS